MHASLKLAIFALASPPETRIVTGFPFIITEQR